MRQMKEIIKEYQQVQLSRVELSLEMLLQTLLMKHTLKTTFLMTFQMSLLE